MTNTNGYCENWKERELIRLVCNSRMRLDEAHCNTTDDCYSILSIESVPIMCINTVTGTRSKEQFYDNYENNYCQCANIFHGPGGDNLCLESNTYTMIYLIASGLVFLSSLLGLILLVYPVIRICLTTTIYQKDLSIEFGILFMLCVVVSHLIFQYSFFSRNSNTN